MKLSSFALHVDAKIFARMDLDSREKRENKSVAKITNYTPGWPNVLKQISWFRLFLSVFKGSEVTVYNKFQLNLDIFVTSFNYETSFFI